jgi:hypothetical protein
MENIQGGEHGEYHFSIWWLTSTTIHAVLRGGSFRRNVGRVSCGWSATLTAKPG